MNNNETKLSPGKEGLPLIARTELSNNTRFFIVMGLILAVSAITLYVKQPTSNGTMNNVEESYALTPGNITEPVSQQDANKKDNSETNNLTPKQLSPEQVALIQEQQKELQDRLSAPLMIVQNKTGDNFISDKKIKNKSIATQDVSGKARTLAPLNYVITEGTLIHAILENATNSDLPGYLRAIVSNPVYSADGSEILIPRGSRLVGQYKNGTAQGQSRVFALWTRVITPTGISVDLSSSGVDILGVSGIGGDNLNRHFWERFGTATLLSIIGAGASSLGVSRHDQDNSISTYRSSIANGFSQSADESLQQQSNIPPTLETYQGKAIMVFVARDLNFETAIKQTYAKINVF